MLIANPEKVQASLKFIVSYNIDDETTTEMGEIESLPEIVWNETCCKFSFAFIFKEKKVLTCGEIVFFYGHVQECEVFLPY